MSEFQSPVPAPAPGARAPEISRSIYGMPMFATLLVVDVDATVSWYLDGLGFVSLFTLPGENGPALVHLRRWQFQDLLGRPAPGVVSAGTGCTLSFAAVYDEMQALAAGGRAHGGGSVDGPVDTAWNTRDLTTTDPDGDVVIFTAARPPDSEDAAFSQQMGQLERRAKASRSADGILDLLSPAELEGVLAHELSHVQNRDVIVMTVASFFASVASLIMKGFWLARPLGGSADDEDEGSQWRKRQIAVAVGLFLIPVILVCAAVYMVSFLLLRALSRYREFAADRGSAIITGRPSALISALMKISGNMHRIPQQDLRAASRELTAFYIFPPGAKKTVVGILATHPPLEQRIAALQRLEAQLQGTA